MNQATPQASEPGRSAEELSPEARKKVYKKSLNLPKTSFPMRANLAQNEPQSQKRWRKENLYGALMAAREGAEPFVFHDGPPYANGEIHVGHLLNKVLKDLVVRTRAVTGKHCPFIPGWDCHGLPIEHKVVTGLVQSGKIEKLRSLTEDQRRMAIRRECQRSAEKFQKLQAEQMQRLSTLADYDEPYMTMSPGYEEGVLEVFAEMVEQGLVYRALKPVHWSIANETALAEAELEYQDREDPSVYVRFEARDPAALAAAFGLEPEAAGPTPAFLIWTTTPWTLPANLLIAVEESFDYVLVRFDGGPTSVVAAELVPAVARAAGVGEDKVEILGSTKGARLLDLTYCHPFRESPGSGGEGSASAWQVVSAAYVTLEDGTGLVHTAPGHGQDDYQTGLGLGMEIYSPVRGDGTYDDTVPEWLRGLSVWEANPKIVERLEASGHLTASHQFTHSYPHDWRSKTPVIFRGTEQWFVAVDQATERDGASLREMAQKAAEHDIRFVPAWGVKRLSGMLESRPDWCISRQRAWGLPIPAFRDAADSVLLTPRSVAAVAAVFRREGSDAWFLRGPEDLLADYDLSQDPEAPEGLDPESLAKMHDILDVWFESGSSWHAAMRRRGQGFPIDLYLEGSDQHRGWFQLSLLTSLGATGESPFKALLTHGFMVDKDGRKMSKSVGNALEVEELLKDFGADVCRWWVSSLAFENEFKVDLSFFELAGESYRKVRNTLRFLLSNLMDFDPAGGPALEAVPATSVDGYALQAAAELRRKVLAAYDDYEFRQAHLALFDFCNETLSSFYLDAVKDRLYCDQPDSERRRRSQAVLHHLAELLSTLLAPIVPHTADEAWRALHGEGGGGSVHLQTVPPSEFEADSGWAEVFEVRERAQKALENAKAAGIENPLDAGLRLGDPKGTLDRFATEGGQELLEIFGVSRVELTRSGEDVEVVDLREEPRCERSWRRDGTVRRRGDGGFLSDRDYQAVMAAAESEPAEGAS